jgi:ATP-binding cassette subfamily C protein
MIFRARFPGVLQKNSHDCGAACAASVCRYWGIPTTLRDSAEQMQTGGIDGTDPRALEAFLRRQGLHVVAGEMDHLDLKSHGKRLRPVICVTQGHYLCVLGVYYNVVHLHDPESGYQEIQLADFLPSWRDHDRLGASYTQWGIAAWLGE